jgi:hypothetical protein
MSKISQSAQQAFEGFARRALETSLSTSAAERCEVTVHQDASRILGQHMVLLTVSSYLFRATTMVFFTLDPALRQHLAALNRREPDSMGEDEHMDALGEVGNIFCGALNRDLVPHFRYLGMSTPNVLDRRCIDYIDQLGAGFVRHFEVVVNAQLTLHATVCVSAFADIDFRADTAVAEESHGELEMF